MSVLFCIFYLRFLETQREKAYGRRGVERERDERCRPQKMRTGPHTLTEKEKRGESGKKGIVSTNVPATQGLSVLKSQPKTRFCLLFALAVPGPVPWGPSGSVDGRGTLCFFVAPPPSYCAHTLRSFTSPHTFLVRRRRRRSSHARILYFVPSRWLFLLVPPKSMLSLLISFLTCTHLLPLRPVVRGLTRLLYARSLWISFGRSI